MSNIEHFVSADQVTVELANQLISRAEAFKKGAKPSVELPAYAANLFFEASTRTHTSFEMAERKLGMTVLPFDPRVSSVSKGETLGDTLRTLAAIGVQVAVMRHPKDDYYAPLIKEHVPVHIVNAGDGAGQHPSQMMLDLMTIHEEFGHFDGLKVGICGDLSHSRVAKSDMLLLKKLGATLYFAGPKAWYTDEFKEYGPHLSIDELAPKVDVLMLLRVQLERFSKDAQEDFSADDYYKRFGLTDDLYKQLQPQTIIMHPAPVNRGVEIASDLVESPKSRIFRQMQNGVFMRMAILELVMKTPLQLEGSFAPNANVNAH